MGKKNFFAQGKYRVRWKNNAVFSLEKTVLDRIPLYKRTVLKEECLYISFESPDSWLLDCWGTRAWQTQRVAMFFSTAKYTYYKQSVWHPYGSATPLSSRNLKGHYQGFQMIYHLFLCYLNFLIYKLKYKISLRAIPNNMVPSVCLFSNFFFYEFKS